VNFGNFRPGFDYLTGQQIHFYIKFGYIYMEIEKLSTSREDSGIELERSFGERWRKHDVYALISYYKVEEAKRII